MAATYVVITDLDRTYTTATHPTLSQVTKYLRESNSLLSAWQNSSTETDSNEVLKDVGIEITENKIHNRKVKDNIPGYQFYRPTGLTLQMKDHIISQRQWSSKFSFNPGSSSFI